MTTEPQIFDGIKIVKVIEGLDIDNTTFEPVHPEEDGDGTIFVSVASYRGTYQSN